MKVYVVITRGWEDGEDSSIQGVYGSKEEAKTAVLFSKPHHAWFEEHEIETVFRSVFEKAKDS